MDHDHIPSTATIQARALNYVAQTVTSTNLLLTAMAGETEKVEQYINEGANLEVKNSRRQTPLILAARNGYADIVSLLIENGADIKARDIDGENALIHASVFNHSYIVRLLIQKSGSPEAIDNNNRTALTYAILNKHSDVINLCFSMMNKEKVQELIEINSNLNISKNFNDFKNAVIEHRMSVFKILRPLAFESHDANKPNFFLDLPTDILGVIMSFYSAIVDEKAWHIPHAHLDGPKISEAIAKTRLLTFSADAPGPGKKRTATDTLEEERGIKKAKIKDLNEAEHNNDDVFVEEIEIESNNKPRFF